MLKSRASFFLVALSSSLIVVLGCSNKAPSNAGAASASSHETSMPDPTSAPTPDEAVFTTPDRVKYDVIIPNVAEFADVVGDRNAGPHGTFVKIKRGTGTPPHVHSRPYQAVVLKGLVENPFPQNSGPTMGVGSFYSVPANAEHITRCAAKSPTDCMTFFFQTGAFDFSTDVKSTDPALGKDAVFTLPDAVKFDIIIPNVAQFGDVGGDREKGAHSTFVKINKGTGTPPHTHSSSYDAVILQGLVENPIPSNQANPVALVPGSYYHVPAGVSHITRCSASSDANCMTFFYQSKAFDFTASK